MAIETEQSGKEATGDYAARLRRFVSKATLSVREAAPGVWERACELGKSAAEHAGTAFLWILGSMRRTWLMQFISRSLLRRIVFSNLIGLFIVLLGLAYLSKFNSWLIDSKLEHLSTQSRTMAAAIASRATLTQIVPKGTSEPAGSSLEALRDDPFAAIEFSIQPERVTPLLPSLLADTNNRARVYDVNGNLIADSSRILTPADVAAQPTEPREKTKTFWTRVVRELLRSKLDVYKDIGDANGRSYPEVVAALQGETRALLMLTRAGEQIVSVAAPIKRGDSVRGVLLLSTVPGALEEVQAEQLLTLMVPVLIAMIAAIIASIVLERTVAEPMRRLSNVAEAVTHDIRAAKDLPTFEDRRADEVGQLAESLRVMTQALYRRIEASEKFAADVAHELKNPLAAARATAESLNYARTDAQRDELVEQIQREIKRLDRLISDVSNASRLDAELALQSFEPFDVGVLARDVVAMFRDVHAEDSRRIRLDVRPTTEKQPFIIAGQSGRIGQVLTNLLSNALSFSPEGSEVRVILRRTKAEIELIVEDEGPGIAGDKLEKIFERFYTYRPTAESSRGDNSGLGLAISREIVEAHGGSLHAENRGAEPSQDGVADSTADGQVTGARFVARLPVAQSRPSANRQLGGGR